MAILKIVDTYMTNTKMLRKLFRQCILMTFILEDTTRNFCVNMWPTGGI